LIDADSYLLELVRYIHCNPVRAGLVQSPDQYQWSSHRTYLGRAAIPWLTTDWVLSQFAARERKARELYEGFIAEGIDEEYRAEFHKGLFEGRILGDDRFSEKSLARAEEKFQRWVSEQQIMAAVCKEYGLSFEELVEPGKRQPAATARAIAAFLVQESGNLSLTELSNNVQRDLAALSRAAERLRHRVKSHPDQAKRIAAVRQQLEQISDCQT
jgi:putative transposase